MEDAVAVCMDPQGEACAERGGTFDFSTCTCLVPAPVRTDYLNARAEEIVRSYALEHLDPDVDSDENANVDAPGSGGFDVFTVWQCHILGSRKWLMATTLRDGMYYEVTYDAAKATFYLDAYRKQENRSIPVEPRYA